MVWHWCFYLGNVQVFCLGRIGRARLCLLQAGKCDVAKHGKNKLVVREDMVHMMAPATKQTNRIGSYWPSRPEDLTLIRNTKRSNFEQARKVCLVKPLLPTRR
jgi:hypothetical protein